MTVRQLSNGFYVYVEDSGAATLARCSWLVEVASGNPEPDSVEDLYDVIECGGRMVRMTDAGSFACEHGHEYTSIFEGGFDVEARREQEERFAETGRV